ncbi:glutamine synthetase [Chytriomyces confervae]|uniref:Glutamine synthetase n=1 Tax=Chytriomyces confervae TaxID=246404 RepID=A0A507DLS4_9FUNG|nr:glutamine synthetase [Chytriomyces confervae]
MHAIFAPTINSYKRLVENYWAPITVSYGVENRTASIRLITPPTAPPSATRLEIRVPGADMNPYLTVAAILAAGYDGIARRLPLPFPPAEVQAKLEGGRSGEKRLARDLYQALEAMREEGSSARRVLGDAFVEHYVGTRLHEWRLWETAVTNWEVSRHAGHVLSVQQRALNELNFYRKLLQMDPLASLDAFDSSTGNDEPISSINRSASFETMPPEILDRIVQFVDGNSILSLCHAMPYYKYISTAMFDFAQRFPDDYYKPSELWPDLYLPTVRNDKTKTTDFPIQHLHAAGVYSRIVSKNGGHVHVPCSKNVLNYLGAFPDVLSVHNGDDGSGSGRANFLRALADANKRIRSCTIGILMQDSALMQNSSLPEIDVPEVVSEDNSFSRCLTLTELGFAEPLGLEDCAAHQRALNELNSSAQLLQLDPVTCVDAFELSADDASVESTLCKGSITCSAGLETMPPEMLDRIVLFVDGGSILRLCHAIPYYKYISTAMFELAHRFPKPYSPYMLWPDMYLPMAQFNTPQTTDVHAAGVYARIISKHGGNFYVPSSRNLLNYVEVLPEVLSIYSGNDYLSDRWATFLCGLADAKKQISSCRLDSYKVANNWGGVAHQLTRLQIQSLIWQEKGRLPVKIWNALPFISGLSYLELDLPEAGLEKNSLSRCLTLREIMFRRLLANTKQGSAKNIVHLIKGSRIKKVWCKKQRSMEEFQALKAITSGLLKHGWHKEELGVHDSLHQRALDELNLYRKLLQMDALTSMDAFELSTDAAIDERTPCLRSITRSASFETIPPEILDRIVCFVDSNSILPLCHALPYYKYISTAMFGFAHRFECEGYTLSMLWPDLHLPVNQNEESETTHFPIQHLYAAGTYARIISKHGGVVQVPCSKNAFNYFGALPDVVSVCPGDDYSMSEWIRFLHTLANAKKQIRSCAVDTNSVPNDWLDLAIQLTRLPIRSLIWEDHRCLPEEIWDSLPDISGLAYLEIPLPEEEFENDSLAECMDLKGIAFTQLLDDTYDGLVEYMLRLIKGSSVEKVWCQLILRAKTLDDEDELVLLASAFLKRGWHLTTGLDDDKPCFVYRNS